MSWVSRQIIIEDILYTHKNAKTLHKLTPYSLEEQISSYTKREKSNDENNVLFCLHNDYVQEWEYFVDDVKNIFL